MDKRSGIAQDITRYLAPPTASTRKRITVYLSDNEFNDFQVYCENKKVSMSDATRQLIKQVMLIPASTQPTPTEHVSLFDGTPDPPAPAVQEEQDLSVYDDI